MSHSNEVQATSELDDDAVIEARLRFLATEEAEDRCAHGSSPEGEPNPSIATDAEYRGLHPQIVADYLD